MLNKFSVLYKNKSNFNESISYSPCYLDVVKQINKNHT